MELRFQGEAKKVKNGKEMAKKIKKRVDEFITLLYNTIRRREKAAN